MRSGTETPAILAMGDTADWCYDNTPDSSCSLVEVGPGEVDCLCALGGLVINIPGGPGVPPEPPEWPDPPGFPDADPINWPEPPGGGTWPDLPPPEPGECDPNGFMDPCEYNASLRCTTGVVRGSHVECRLEVEPSQVSVEVVVWTFKADAPNGHLSVYRPSSSMTWSGKAVVSGRVQVDFLGGGREATRVSRIHVLPRGWSWSVGNGIDFLPGGLATHPGDWAEPLWGRLCHPVEGCAPPYAQVPQGRWFVQPQNPVHGNGYFAHEVADGGPNDALWYVESVAVDVQMASAINPDYLAAGPLRPQGCGGIPSANIWQFNHSPCGTGDPGWGSLFTTHVWAHEELHAQKATGFVGARPEFDVPRVVEDLIASTSSELTQQFDRVTEGSGRCIGFAAALHGTALGGPPHPPTAFDVWWWNSIPSEFVKRSAGTPDPPDGPVSPDCL